MLAVLAVLLLCVIQTVKNAFAFGVDDLFVLVLLQLLIWSLLISWKEMSLSTYLWGSVFILCPKNWPKKFARESLLIWQN